MPKQKGGSAGKASAAQVEMHGVDRRNVPVSDKEALQIIRALPLLADKLETEIERVRGLGGDPSSLEEMLALHRGNGGGLAKRFEKDSTGELFPDVPEPAGMVRQLEDVMAGEDPTSADPLPVAELGEGEPEYFAPSLIAQSLQNTRGADFGPFGGCLPVSWHGSLVEDQEGKVFQVAVDVSVRLVYVGTRSATMVDAAVAASDKAAGAPIANVEEKKLDALRKLAVVAIQGESALTVKARELLQQYAEQAADREWLLPWTQSDVPIGRRPQVPEDWYPKAPAPTPVPTSEDKPTKKYPPAPQGTPIEDVEGMQAKFSPKAWEVAYDNGLRLEELKRYGLKKGSGSNGNFVMTDVVAILGERSSESAPSAEA